MPELLLGYIFLSWCPVLEAYVINLSSNIVNIADRHNFVADCLVNLRKSVTDRSPIDTQTKEEATFVYQKLLLLLSKPQAWYIIIARSAVHIISPFGAVYHHAPACIILRLDEIQHFVLMIYNASH